MSFDPNLGAWFPFLGMGGMMAPKNHDNNEGKDDGAPEWLRWAHIGTTVTLALFLFGIYEKGQSTVATMQSRIDVLSEQVRELREANTTQDAMRATQMEAITYRLNAQRDNIKELQRDFGAHKDEDRRIYRRRSE